MLHHILAGFLCFVAQDTGDVIREAKTETQDETEMRFRSLSIRALSRARRNAAIPIVGPLLPRGLWRRETATHFYPGGDSYPLVEPDELAELLPRLDGEERWEGERTRIAARGGRLHVVQNAAGHARLRTLLAAITAHLAPTLRVEVVLFDRRERRAAWLQRFSGFKRLDRAEATRLATAFAKGGAGVLHREALDTRPGASLHSGFTETGNYVVDINCEVAQESFISDPVVETVPFATGISLLPILQPDGRGIALHGVLTRRVPGAVRPMPVKSPDVDFIDQVESKETQVVFSTSLDAGGAFVLAPGGRHQGDLCAFVRIERPGPAPAPARPDLLIVPRDMMGMRPSKFDVRVPRDRPDDEDDEERESEAWAEDVEDLLQALAGGEEAVQVSSVEAAFFVRGKPAILGKARELFDRLTRERRRSFVLTLIVEVRPRGSEDAWQPLGAPRTLPVLGYQRGLFVQGTGRSYVRDANVEIARAAAGPDPVVHACFDGTQLAATVRPEADSCCVELRIVDTAVDGLRPTRARSEVFDHLVGPKQRTAHRSRELVMKAGESRVIGRLPPRRLHARTHEVRARLTLQEL